ncbi:hypothetical protein [Acinetobacter bouvetii]|nr:hypothetical protein [Acinetobacter bouvetii]
MNDINRSAFGQFLDFKYLLSARHAKTVHQNIQALQANTYGSKNS